MVVPRQVNANACRIRNIDLNKLNRDQALVPETCTVLPNKVGSAPGMWFEKKETIFVSLPGVPFEMNPYFIVNTLSVMRGAVYALREGFILPYNEAMFRAMWVDGRNLGDPAVVVDLLTEAGLDAEAIVAGAQDPQVKRELMDRTNEAVVRGIFGAPSFFVGNDLYFGQARLDWVERALTA